MSQLNISKFSEITPYVIPDMTWLNETTNVTTTIITKSSSVTNGDWVSWFLIILFIILVAALLDPVGIFKYDFLSSLGIAGSVVSFIAGAGLILGFINDWSLLTSFGMLTFIVGTIKYLKS